MVCFKINSIFGQPLCGCFHFCNIIFGVSISEKYKISCLNVLIGVICCFGNIPRAGLQPFLLIFFIVGHGFTGGIGVIIDIPTHAEKVVPDTVLLKIQNNVFVSLLR